MDKESVKAKVLDDVKRTYLIEEDEDGSNEEYINLLTSYAFDEFTTISGTDTIKEKHIYMIFQVVSKRYSRRGDEAKKSVKAGSITETYTDDTGFEVFKDIIEREYKDKGATGYSPTVTVY